MIAISARHVPILLGLLAILLLPFLRTSFEVRRVEDCADPEALLELGKVQGGRRATERWEKYDEDVVQWTVVDLLGNDDRVELRGTMIRSFRPSELYVRPPRYLLGTFEAGQQDAEDIAVGDAVLPIHTIRDVTHGRNSLASWLFLYLGEPVRHPILEQLQTAPRQVWSGSRPLTLLIAGGAAPPGRLEEARKRTQRWLVAAYQHHREACLR